MYPPTNAVAPPAAKPYHNLPLKLVIQAKYIGAIIGHGGNTIRDIAKTSGAKCVVDVQTQMHDERGIQENMVVINGTVDSCSKACLKILQITHSEIERERGAGVNVEMKVRVINQLVGRLIGKGGSSVKAIMEETGATISINDTHPMEYNHYSMVPLDVSMMDRTIVIRGNTLEIVSHAERRISQKLRLFYENDLSANRIQPIVTGTNKKYAPMMSYPPPPLLFVNSPVGAAAIYQNDGGVNSYLAGPPIGGSNGPASNSMMFCQPPFNGPYSQRINVQPNPIPLKSRIHIPSTCIGSIIGTKGCYIRAMTQFTGATIIIESTDKEQRRRSEAIKSDKMERDVEVNEKESTNVDDNGNKQTAVTDGAENAAMAQGSATTVDEKRQGLSHANSANTTGHNSNGKTAGEAFVIISGLDYQVLRAEFWIYQRIAESSMKYFEEVTLTTEVYVPSKIIGRIIGRNGHNVRELQRITRASVKMPDDVHQLAGNNVAAAGDGALQQPVGGGNESSAGQVPPSNEETPVIVVGSYHSLQAVQCRFSLLIVEIEQRELSDQKNRFRNYGQHKSSAYDQPRGGRNAAAATDREMTLTTPAAGDSTPPTAEFAGMAVADSPSAVDGDKAQSV